MAPAMFWAVPLVVTFVLAVAQDPWMEVNDGRVQIATFNEADVDFVHDGQLVCSAHAQCAMTSNHASAIDGIQDTQATFSGNLTALAEELKTIHETHLPDLNLTKAGVEELNELDGVVAQVSMLLSNQASSQTKAASAISSSLETLKTVELPAQLADKADVTVVSGLSSLLSSISESSDMTKDDLSALTSKVDEADMSMQRSTSSLVSSLANTDATLARGDLSLAQKTDAGISTLTSTIAHVSSASSTLGRTVDEGLSSLTQATEELSSADTSLAQKIEADFSRLLADPCARDVCPDHAVCVNLAPAYRCDCEEGYYHTDAMTCVRCPEGLTTHTPGSYSCPLSYTWEAVGTLADLDRITTQYPDTHYDLGLSYNSDDILSMYWNVPRSGLTQVIAHPFYPQNDNTKAMEFGTTTFHRGLANEAEEDKHLWRHLYYRVLADGSYDTSIGGNGFLGNLQIYARPNIYSWKKVGVTKDLNDIMTQYPEQDYVWGVRNKGMIQTAYYNTWNRGHRVTLFPFFPNGDDMSYVASVLTKDLDGGSATKWTLSTIKVPDSVVGSAVDAEDLDVFVQPRVHSWFQDDTLKTLGDISAIRSKYDLSLYEFGIDYNDGIRVAFQNSWNRGSRISIYPFYFQGDSISSLHLGTSAFLQNLGGLPNTNDWFHYYFEQNQADGSFRDALSFGNGAKNDAPVWLRRRMFPWIKLGDMTNFNTYRDDYSHTAFEFGGAHNGDIQIMHWNGWNRGERLSLMPIYLMQDTVSTVEYGTSIYTRDVDSTSWTHAYYLYPKTWLGSNGNVDTRDIYVRRVSWDAMAHACAV